MHAVESLSRGRDRLNGGELSSVPVLPAPNETIVSEANTADN